MKALAGLLEQCWLWAYTAGMPPEEADDRRAEIRSDWWEFSAFAKENPRLAGGRLRRLFRGLADDIAWRADFGRDGLSAARAHEAALLVAIAGFLFFTIPATAWWVVALAGDDPSEPQLQIWYLGSTALSLACAVVGGAASAAYYPRAGRTLMLAGCLGMAATLWWTPLSFIVGVAGVATVFALPTRSSGDSLRN